MTPHTGPLPPEERETARGINLNLVRIIEFANAVEAATQLAFYEFPDDPLLSRQVRLEWVGVAVRDIAMMVYHVGTTLPWIRSLLDQAPTLRQMVDLDKLEEAESKLAEHFPEWEAVRHALGHLGGDSVNFKRQAEHGWSGWTRPMGGKPPAPMYERTFKGTTLYLTRKGQRHVFRVTEDTGRNLAEVIQLVSDAFSEARKINGEAARKRAAETRAQQRRDQTPRR